MEDGWRRSHAMLYLRIFVKNRWAYLFDKLSLKNISRSFYREDESSSDSLMEASPSKLYKVGVDITTRDFMIGIYGIYGNDVWSSDAIYTRERFVNRWNWLKVSQSQYIFACIPLCSFEWLAIVVVADGVESKLKSPFNRNIIRVFESEKLKADEWKIVNFNR